MFLLLSTPSQTVLGKIIHRPAILDRKLSRELKALSDPTQDPYDVVSGKTMCTYDFYEGQGRLDGAFCEFTEADKMEYLEKLREFGVVNIEMEGEAKRDLNFNEVNEFQFVATIFAALTLHAGIKAAIVCVALLNRLNGDQVSGDVAESLI